MSLFTLFACADVGEKINFELAFNGRPSLTDLHTRIVEAFVVAMDNANRGAPVFLVSSIAIYDVNSAKWNELEDAGQLTTNCQLYVFQNHATDPPKIFPAPVLPPHALPPESGLLKRQASQVRYVPTTPVTDYSTSLSLANPTQRRASSLALSALSTPHDTDKLFDLLDKRRSGTIRLSDLRDAMLLCRLDISPQSVGDTFLYGDQDIIRAEFRGFGDTYPQVVMDLLSHLKQTEDKEFGRLTVSASSTTSRQSHRQVGAKPIPEPTYQVQSVGMAPSMVSSPSVTQMSPAVTSQRRPLSGPGLGQETGFSEMQPFPSHSHSAAPSPVQQSWNSSGWNGTPHQPSTIRQASEPTDLSAVDRTRPPPPVSVVYQPPRYYDVSDPAPVRDPPYEIRGTGRPEPGITASAHHYSTSVPTTSVPPYYADAPRGSALVSPPRRRNESATLGPTNQEISIRESRLVAAEMNNWKEERQLMRDRTLSSIAREEIPVAGPRQPYAEYSRPIPTNLSSPARTYRTVI